MYIHLERRPNFLLVFCTKGGVLVTVTALYDIGCFFGAIATIAIEDLLGRKKAILLGTTVMNVGAILQISAFSIPQMIAGP